jgi:D-glycero-alpha-D-manno-heptose-7-phosphate kinase
LPARSGIGSSSSFTVGLLHALYALKQQMKSPRQLAEEAIDVEQNWLNESVGIQDQIMAAHGGFQIIEMRPSANWNVKNMLMPKEYFRSLEDHVLLGFSGISRFSEQHAKNKVDNIKLGKTNIELQTIYELTHEALQAFQNQAGFDEIGRLLDQSWQCKRRLAEGVSSDRMDVLYETAIHNGAFGGKLMGAGGGGFFFFLAPPNKHQQIREALSQIKVWVPFKIDHSGSQVIFYNGN